MFKFLKHTTLLYINPYNVHNKITTKINFFSHMFLCWLFEEINWVKNTQNYFHLILLLQKCFHISYTQKFGLYVVYVSIGKQCSRHFYLLMSVFLALDNHDQTCHCTLFDTGILFRTEFQPGCPGSQALPSVVFPW